MEGVWIHTVTKHQIILLQTKLFFISLEVHRDLFQQLYSHSCKGNHIVCRNQLWGNFRHRLHIDANGTAPQEMKHKLWSTFTPSYNPISSPQAWRWNFRFYIYFKSHFLLLPASLLDISRGVNRINPRQLFVLLVQMLFLSPNILTLCLKYPLPSS